MKSYNSLSQLKKSWKSDMNAGFMVFILALPLSLGIAKASGYPAAMGVLSAIVGGMATVFYKVSPLSIKGPAAGLITISAAAMIEFGANEHAWQTVSAAVLVMAILQIVTGMLKLGSLSDFFPHSAVHGMLAAIGIIIILKQIPVLLGDEPNLYKGEGPIELLLDLPNFISHAHWHIAVVGVVSLIILFVFPKINSKILKSLPAPLIVLLVTVPLSFYWHFKDLEPAYSLVSIGDFWGAIGFNIDFSAFTTFTFWKYVIMFYFVCSLESLLTVKAVDGLDPEKRISDPNGDLIGQGSANAITGLLGGLPVISEVIRSSANVSFKAQSKWSNFFHGFFLLLAMVFMIPFIELIPNAALAAMLIYAGYNLTAPKHFIHAFKVGKEQLLIFLVTIIVTLAEDLLLGIAAGIVVKFLVEISNGVPLKSLFKANFDVIVNDGTTLIKVKDCAVFSNLIGLKKAIEKNLEKGCVRLDLSEAKYLDHTFMAYIKYLEREKDSSKFTFNGLENHRKRSDHPESALKLVSKRH